MAVAAEEPLWPGLTAELQHVSAAVRGGLWPGQRVEVRDLVPVFVSLGTSVFAPNTT